MPQIADDLVELAAEAVDDIRTEVADLLSYIAESFLPDTWADEKGQATEWDRKIKHLKRNIEKVIEDAQQSHHLLDNGSTLQTISRTINPPLGHCIQFLDPRTMNPPS